MTNAASEHAARHGEMLTLFERRTLALVVQYRRARFPWTRTLLADNMATTPKRIRKTLSDLQHKGWLIKRSIGGAQTYVPISESLWRDQLDECVEVVRALSEVELTGDGKMDEANARQVSFLCDAAANLCVIADGPVGELAEQDHEAAEV